jgi:hypothetical protein
VSAKAGGGRVALGRVVGLSLTILGCQAAPRGAAGPAASAAVSGFAQGAEADERGSFELPARHSQVTPAAQLPAVPAALRSPIDVTLELETTIPGAGGDVTRREDVARSAERIHIRLDRGAVEWLFVQNPVDERRVSATLVDHRQRAIIEYAESELRTSGIARGWADVACLGIGAEALEALESLEPTGRRERRFGFDFLELNAAAGSTRPAQVWWSEDAALPLRAVRGAPPLRFEVRALRRGVDRERFAEPRQRFASYSLLDIADYREKHHDAKPATPER